jgi:hypothetical protein
MKFNKADLLWEATRRNEDYKSLYFEVVGKDVQDIWKRIWHPWNYNWKMDGLLHPDITIDDIKTKIELGCKVELIHPYYYILKPIVQYEDLNSLRKDLLDMEVSIKIDDYRYRCYINSIIDRYIGDSSRLLFSIDLMGDDLKITKRIKSLKKKFRKNYKLICSNNAERLFNPIKIDSYIMWLRKYDKIVQYLDGQYGRDNLIIDSGAIVIPEKFSFNEVVPGDTKKNFETERKAMKEAYEGSVLLIQKTPNIKFSFPRS